MTKEEFIQQLEDSTSKLFDLAYDQLVNVGRKYYDAVIGPIFKYFEEDTEKSCGFIIALVSSCIGIDGSLSDTEIKYINDVLDVNATVDYYKQVADNFVNNTGINAIDAVVDSLDSDAKINLSVLCSCIFSVDKRLEEIELEYLAKIMC